MIDILKGFSKEKEGAIWVGHMSQSNWTQAQNYTSLFFIWNLF